MRRIESDESRCFIVRGGEVSSNACGAMGTAASAATTGVTASADAIAVFVFAVTVPSCDGAS